MNLSSKSPQENNLVASTQVAKQSSAAEQDSGSLGTFLNAAACFSVMMYVDSPCGTAELSTLSPFPAPKILISKSKQQNNKDIHIHASA
jgi:hypothetical protein